MLLAHSIACASSLKRWTVMTGPKTSRWASSSSGRRLLHDGRLEEEAGRVRLLAAGDEPRVVGHPVDEAGDVRALAGGVERAERRVGVGGVAEREAAGLLGQRFDDVVVHAVGDEHAGRRRAVLAGVVVAGAGDPSGHRLEVRVVEDHDRRLAAELEVDALERVGGGASDPLAGLDRAGQRDHVDVGMRDQPLAGLAGAGDDVEHALGQDLVRELGEAQRGQRRRLGRLEHDRVAGGERGTDLPDRHQQRVVPGRDLADDADRLAPDHRRVALEVLARRLALHAARGAGEEAQVVDGGGQLVGLDRGERLAGVARLELGEFVGVRLDGVGELAAAPPGARRASCSTRCRTRRARWRRLGRRRRRWRPEPRRSTRRWRG